MQLTPEGSQIIADIAQRYGLSVDAVLTILQAVINGGGGTAQFSHPELGGSGQWMQGGMTMVGDMFNHALKAKVDTLCTELSGLLARQPLFKLSSQSQRQSQGGHEEVSLFVGGSGSSGAWWPAGLGAPSSTGAQNQLRYAIFPATHRLAIEINGHITLYDTLDHQISGVGQQQAGDASFTFTSQYGLVRVADLPVVTGVATAPEQAETALPPTLAKPSPVSEPQRVFAPAHAELGAARNAPSPPTPQDESAIFAKIEGLARLHQKGILTDEEFTSKKAELLSRL